ncbi:Branched-chain amino acid ABC-type transport system, permease component [Parafrankia irregularis]|uniref:Branched-chain amino acid ABC-type transport system, permease component n=1 Tax=Parafrankia irregularis TaxID=795642 RepID=A0A0S4QM28_9ACTN|nr:MULTISPECIES: ABC transporter permease [Parafrankia]MBE3200151.1 ABC transporter permease [Parafrankia sp. CH37]CUU56657.1 Branched-chain amino acid ABC-type transport system, permease component [Parafrankia irregularis]
MDQFVRDVITGSVNGSIYALIAAGLVLTYTTTGIFNLGYAGIAFSAAYVFFELNTGLHWPQWAAATLVILVFCPLLGLLLDVAMFRRLARAPEVVQLVASVGVLLALPASFTFLVGRGITQFGWSIPTGTDVELAPGVGPQPRKVFGLFSGVVITSDQIIVLGTTVVCVVLLSVFLRSTRTGLRMRAVADRHDLAALRGVDPTRTSQLAWVLGTVLAGIAGVVGSPILRVLNPDAYALAVFVAIAAAVVGGFRSVPLAFAGAVLVAVASNLTYSWAGFAQDIPGFNSALPFLLLIVGLIVMARSRARVAGSIAAESAPPDHRRDQPPWRRVLPSVVGVALLLYGIFVGFDDYWLTLTTRALIFSLIFLSFTIVTGLGGMVSLAQASFVAGGQLLAGYLINQHGFPWWLACVAAVLAAMVLGVLVALPSLRLGGVALALVTLALAFVCGQVLFQLDWLRNGEYGWSFTRPVFGPLDLNETRNLAGFVLVLIALVVWVIRNLERSHTGREMLAVRNAAAAAAAIGVSPTITKLKVFALSAGVAGLGGVLLATNDISVTSNSVPAMSGLLWLAGVALLGLRRPSGAILAGLFIGLVPGVLSGFSLPFGLWEWSGSKASEVPTILFGLGAIALARQPDGMLADIARRNFQRRARRRAAATASVSGAAPRVPEITADVPGSAAVDLGGTDSRGARARVSEAGASDLEASGGVAL